MKLKLKIRYCQAEHYYWPSARGRTVQPGAIDQKHLLVHVDAEDRTIYQKTRPAPSPVAVGAAGLQTDACMASKRGQPKERDQWRCPVSILK